MFPLLPALILLLLNGPANIERMAEGGRLPAALQALQQFADQPNQRADIARGERFALASLLSLGSGPELGTALVRILALDAIEPEQAPQKEEPLGAESSPPPTERRRGKTADGFLQSQRSRDGPRVH